MRSSEKEALSVFAAEAGQQCELAWSLDSFGGYREPEGVREADQGSGDRRPVSLIVSEWR